MCFTDQMTMIKLSLKEVTRYSGANFSSTNKKTEDFKWKKMVEEKTCLSL